MDQPNKRPNIILIMTDQMRGDCMGVAGHPDVKTPYLDTLATQGAYFKNAYSACPSCIAARAALMTGMSQTRNGRVGYRDGVTWDYANMLPQVLAQAGYQTACMGKLHVHPPRLSCGFGEVRSHDGWLGYYRDAMTPYAYHQASTDDFLQTLRDRYGSAADVIDTGLECNSWVTRPWPYEEQAHPTVWAVSQSIDFLRRRDRSKPFFLMTSFVRPHPPFDAPRDYMDMYRERDLHPPACGDWNDQEALEKTGRVYDALTGTSDPQLRHEAMAGYYASITHVDHQIGRLLQALAADGALDSAVVLYTSDHGEQLFDHATFRKAYPYQGSIHIPLLLRASADLMPQRGEAPQELAELRDIMPTLLDYAGIAPPPECDGKSLRPLLTPGHSQEEGTQAWRNALHGEHSFGALSNHFIVTPTDKYIWYSQTGREQYFLLREDPREERDLIHDTSAAPRIKALRARLIEELAWREEGYSDGERLISGRTPVDNLTRTR